MKRLLIVNNNLQLGGVQRALVNLLQAVASQYEITLLLFAPEGPLMDRVPPGVRVLAAQAPLRALGVSQARAGQAGAGPFLWRGGLAALTRVGTIRAVFPLLSRTQTIAGEYDAAISYLCGGGERVFYGGCPEVVLRQARARRKICFVHNDFLRFGGNCPYNRSVLARFDRLAAVSRSTAAGLRQALPQAADRVFAVPNCHNGPELLRLAGAYPVPSTPGAVNLFSAARLSPEKGILRMVPLFARLRSQGVPFVWRIAGGGPEEAAIRRQIRALGLEEQVLLLGELDNPYPWLQAADALLVPSYVEAAPMVFGEAQLLGVPILTTATSSAAELVGDPGLGRVLPNEDGPLLSELGRLLADFPRLKFARLPLDNRPAVEAFHRLIEG